MFGGPIWLIPAFVFAPVLMQLPFFIVIWLALTILSRTTNWLESIPPRRFAIAVFLVACTLHLLVWALSLGLSSTVESVVNSMPVLRAPVLFAVAALVVWGSVLVVRGRLSKASGVKVCLVVLVVIIGVQTGASIWASKRPTGLSSGSQKAPADTPVAAPA